MGIGLPSLLNSISKNLPKNITLVCQDLTDFLIQPNGYKVRHTFIEITNPKPPVIYSTKTVS